MRHLSFIELAQKVLEEEKKPLSTDEIWEIAKQKGHDQAVSSKGKTPSATIGARLYIDVRDNKSSVFCKVGIGPRKFSLRKFLTETEQQQLDEQPVAEPTMPKNIDYLEKELHPFLAYFSYLHLKAYTKTIQHGKSKKKDFGEWIHPDMIGCYFPIDEWKPEVYEFSSTVGNLSIKLFSFELKRELSFGNLRESFFQTVSNSSWANESYLVASKISGDEDFRNELRRLSTSFGVGVIALNLSEPDSSEVLFPATNRESLDWDMMNKLATMNPDFREFMKRIKIDIQSKEIRKERYDAVLPPEELIQSLK